jgi:dTDP-4-amino-4,6-dideoxygalactose transaminase
VIYDAAHAFGVEKNNESILNWGDLSILSFHATKTFHTFEGGAIVCKDLKLKKRIDYLKNFGFADEVTVVAPGINGKMNEVSAAMGLLQLEIFEENRLKRKALSAIYRNELTNIPGIKMLRSDEQIKENYSYFPVFINEKEYGKSRDEVYELLKKNEIYARRYFYPLISNFPTYKGLKSAAFNLLPIANKMADEVLCLPIYSELKDHEIKKIIEFLKK